MMHSNSDKLRNLAAGSEQMHHFNLGLADPGKDSSVLIRLTPKGTTGGGENRSLPLPVVSEPSVWVTTG